MVYQFCITLSVLDKGKVADPVSLFRPQKIKIDVELNIMKTYTETDCSPT